MGHESQLVGGCVRDLMLGREPKDFDVVTDAQPETVRKLFRNARLIGRRFRLVHVRFGREIVEVATYRAAPEAEQTAAGLELTEAGRIVRDNVYGAMEDDAWRRDFTINALYYNIADFSVTDYVGGVADLKQGIVRVIGDPEVRLREDPVRMLRAVRFAAKLGFKIEARTAGALHKLAPLLRDVPPSRMFDEVIKLFQGGCALTSFEMLRHYELFGHVFPLTEEGMTREQDGFPITLVPRALANTDTRINGGKSVTPAFLLAVLLWEPARRQADRLMERGGSPHEAFRMAASDVLREQARHTSIPRRFSTPMREIWALQPRFARRHGKHAFRLVQHERFRAAYDFLCLRAEAGEEPAELCEWWTRFQEVDEAETRAMVRAVSPPKGRRGRSRSRKRKAASHAQE